jgi:hypothetical protein
MKPDRLDSLASMHASLISVGAYIDDLIQRDTKMTGRTLLCIIEYLKTVATHCAEKSGVDYKAPLLALLKDTSASRATSGSRLRLTNGSATRKNSMRGGMKSGKGLQLQKYQKYKTPSLGSKALTLTRKATKVAAHAVNEVIDFLRIDEQTKNHLRRLEKLQVRLVEKGNLGRADEIQMRIAEIREMYELLPSVPYTVMAGLILGLTLWTPTLVNASTRTVVAMTTAFPAALAAAATGGVIDTGASVFGYQTQDRALEYARTTGNRTNEIFGVIIESSVPEESRQLGYLMGAIVWGGLVSYATVRYNAYIRVQRSEARQQRIKAQERLNTMLGDEEKKLLTNIPEEEESEVEAQLDRIYTYFGLTDEEKGKTSEQLQALVKEKYTARIRTEHPNRGGRAENFDRTKQMYDEYKDLMVRLS